MLCPFQQNLSKLKGLSPCWRWASFFEVNYSSLCDPMDCSRPGSSVHAIFQARILEWIAISFSRGSSQPKGQTLVFSVWATSESACNAGDSGLVPRWGRSPGERNGNTLQYSCLENPMDRGAWPATVHGVAKSWTQLSDFTFFFFGNTKGKQNGKQIR